MLCHKLDTGHVRLDIQNLQHVLFSPQVYSMEHVGREFRAVPGIGKLSNNLCDSHGHFLANKNILSFVGNEIYLHGMRVVPW